MFDVANVVEYEKKERYDVSDLLKIMEILRAPGGCPWDAEQDHESIKKNFIEETYEVVEAINMKDPGMLCEELGDVLLQVVFHARMEQEKGVFDFNDVADGICKKLIERHPHVFGEVKVSTTNEVLSNWDDIKRRTKGQATQGNAMQKVPRELPALMRADKIQSKARKAGFDWTSVDGALDSLESEIKELKSAMANEGAQRVKEEFGDVLFSAVNVSRFLDVDAEDALSSATDKFMTRFLQVEKLAQDRGIDMKQQPIEKLDELWAEAKRTVGDQ